MTLDVSWCYWILANVKLVCNDDIEYLKWKMPFTELAWLFVQSLKLRGVSTCERDDADGAIKEMDFLRGLNNERN